MRIATLVVMMLMGLSMAWAQQPADRPEFDWDQVIVERADGATFTFDVEMALSRVQQQFGLMHVDSMPQDQGMLFVFDPQRAVSFWMRNTLIPLDMLFIRSDGTIANIEVAAEPLTETSRPSDGVVMAVLELNGGITQLLGIRAGDRVLHPAFGNVSGE